MSDSTEQPTVVVIGPACSTGGMASVMRAQLSGPLKNRYHFFALDNSKRTPPHRTLITALRTHLQMLGELIGLLNRHRPNLVHIHTCSGPTFYRSMVDMWIARLYRVPVLLHIHGGRFRDFLGRTTGFCRWLVRRTLLRADAVVALSDGWARQLNEFEPRLHPTVVPNGVSLPRRNILRTRYPYRLVFIGTLKREKGIDDLLEAVAWLPSNIRRHVQLRVIGPDPVDRLSELRAKCRDLRIHDRVIWRGTLTPSAVRRELEEATFFVLPSHSEAMPLSLLEAMACGLPVVATRVGAVPEVIRNATDGILIEPRNPPQLCQAMKTLILKPALQKQLGRAARARIRTLFHLRQTSERLDEVYRRTCDAREVIS